MYVLGMAMNLASIFGGKTHVKFTKETNLMEIDVLMIAQTAAIHEY